MNQKTKDLIEEMSIGDYDREMLYAIFNGGFICGYKTYEDRHGIDNEENQTDLIYDLITELAHYVRLKGRSKGEMFELIKSKYKVIKI